MIGLTGKDMSSFASKYPRYTVNLNGQWQCPPDKWTNADSRFVVYESFSNRGVASSSAVMYVTLIGYKTFTLYLNSYAESRYDYAIAYGTDLTTQMANTSGYQYDPSAYAIDSGTGWKAVTYELDGGTNTIAISYIKDKSRDYNFDSGYVALPV